MCDSPTGRLKMFCRLLIIVFFGSLCWSPAASRVIQKRAAFYIANETMCIVDGEVYRNGDPVPTDDECERCTCRPPGFSCVLRDCDTKPGCKAVRKAGECCPEYVCGCVHNSRLYEDGELIKDLQNNCYTCRCHGSSISCTFADCLFRGDCPPEYIPGECCPRYDHCPTQGPTTSTTTSPSTMHIIQEELDFVNMTTQHLEKFTSEGTTVKIEDIASSDFTTPADVYTVKFTLSGDKIASIHDFDTTEITTLLPVQTVSYKETIQHIKTTPDPELTTVTLNNGLVVATFNKTATEIVDASIPIIVTESVEPHVNTDDISGVVGVELTSDFYDSSPEVSEIEATLKPLLKGESSTFGSSPISTSKPDETVDIVPQVFVINESEESNGTIEQESSYVETEIDTSSQSEDSTLEGADHIPVIVHATQTTTTGYSEASPGETSTKSFDSKPEIGLTQTTIDDETVTRQSVHDDLQPSSDELHTVSAPLFTQITENMTLHSASFDDNETEHESTDTPEKIALSTKIDDQSFQNENDGETTAQAEGISSTTSNELHLANDSSSFSIVPEHDETTGTSLGSEHGDITIEVTDISSDITETSDSSKSSMETASHEHESTSTVSSKHSETPTVHSEPPEDVEKQTSLNTESLTSIHSHESSSTPESTVNTEKTSLNTEEPYRQTSVKDPDFSDDSYSTFYPKESVSTDNPSIVEDLHTFSYDHVSEGVTTSTDFSTVSYRQYPTTESDSSAIASVTMVSSSVDDRFSPSKSDIYGDLEEVTTADSSDMSKSESVSIHNTEYSVSEIFDSSTDDENYKTKRPSKPDVVEEFENSDKTTTDSAVESSSDYTSSSEIDEADAESQEITTTSNLTQKIFNNSTDDEILNSLDSEVNIDIKSTDEETASKVITDYDVTATDKTDENKSETTAISEASASEITERNTQHSAQPTVTQVQNKHTPSADSIDLSGSESTLEPSTADLSSLYSLTEQSHFTKTSTDTLEPAKAEEVSSTLSPTETTDIVSVSHEVTESTIIKSSSIGHSTLIDSVFDLNSNSDAEFSTEPFSQEIKSDKPVEIVHAKPDSKIYDAHGTTSKQTVEPIKITSEVTEVEKLPTTTESHVPDKDLEFEPPLANIFKQQMLFKRPTTEKEITTTIKPDDVKYNIPLDKSKGNQEERLPLTVEETTKSPHNLSFIGEDYENKIFVLNHDYTISDTEINISEVSVDGNIQEVSETNRNNLHSFQIDRDDFEKIPAVESSTTSISGEKSPLESDSLSPIENYNENNDLIAEIMDSEELSNETVLNENDDTTENPHDLNLLSENLDDNALSKEQSFSMATPIQNTDFDLITDHSFSDDIENDRELHSTETDSFSELTQSIQSSGSSKEVSKDAEIMSTTSVSLDFVSHHTNDFISNNDNASKHLDEVYELGIDNQTNMHEDVFGNDFITSETDGSDVNTEYESTKSTEYLDDISPSALDMHSHLVSALQSITHSLTPSVNETSSQTPVNNEFDRTSTISEVDEEYSTPVRVNILFGQSSPNVVQHYETTASFSNASNDDHTLNTNSTHSVTDIANKKESTSDIIVSEYHEHSSDGETSYEHTNEQYRSHSTTDSNSLSNENSFTASDSTDYKNESISNENPKEDSSSPFTILEYIGDLFSGVSTSTFSNGNEASTTQLESESEDVVNESESFVANTVHSKNENETQSLHEIYSSRLKEEMAGYGSLGGVFITGKSKYNGSSVKEQMENPDNDTFEKVVSNALIEEKIKLDDDTTHSISHNYSDNHNGFEEEMNAEENESIAIEEILTDDTVSTVKTSEEMSSSEMSTAKTESITEIKSTIDDTVTNADVDETSSERTTEISEQALKGQLDAKDFDDSLLTKGEIKQQEGPEKGGEWFEATDPDLSLVNAIKVETTSDANTISDSGNVNYDLVNETDVDHGPEKGGEVFEPPFPEVFPISNENSDIKNDSTITSATADGSTQTTTTKSAIQTLNENVTSYLRSTISESEYDIAMTDESAFKSEFMPPLPIWLKSFNINKKSNDTVNDSKSVANPNKNENSHMNEDYLSDEESDTELSSTAVFGRSFEHPYHLSDVIAKVFKAPGYDSEIYLSPLGYPSSKKSKLLRSKRDAVNTDIVDSSSPSNTVASDDTQPFNNKNILLVEGYGQKPSGFFPVTSSFIVVHSDEENETDPKREEAKSKREEDISVVEILRDDLSTNPKKEARPDFR